MFDCIDFLHLMAILGKLRNHSVSFDLGRKLAEGILLGILFLGIMFENGQYSPTVDKKKEVDKNVWENLF